MKKKADLYTKVVYWSQEDECFVGMCPELIFGGVHGNDALNVFIELNQAIEEAIQIFEEEGRPLPEPKAVQFEAA
jgi:predicted RNase H-like HicB family nuclease